MADAYEVVCALFGPRGGALLMGLGLLAACTRANPAYRIVVHDEDAAASPPQVEPDAAPSSLPPDATPADPSPPEDAAPPPDVAARPDLTAPPDLVIARDLAGPPDLAPDGGVSTTGLVAHWRFDERSGTTAADATGNGNTGAIKGGALWAAGFPAAKFSNPGALALDGLDDYVEITPKSTIPGNAAPKSMCAWFKPVDPTASLIRTMLAMFNDTTDVGIQLGVDQGRLAAWYYGYPTPLLNAAGKLDGNWHHAAYTFDGKTHRLYLDGKLEMSVDSMPGAGAMNRARIGTYQAPDEMFAGTVDDVRIYSRPLSDAEVTMLWSGQ